MNEPDLRRSSAGSAPSRLCSTYRPASSPHPSRQPSPIPTRPPAPGERHAAHADGHDAGRSRGSRIAAAAAVAVAITITSQPGGHAGFQRIATLTGAGNASGYVDVGRADGAVEPVVVSISHLDPSPGDQYYEIWFQTGGKDVPGVAFNAGSERPGGSPPQRPDQHEVGAMLDYPPIHQRPEQSTIVMRAS